MSRRHSTRRFAPRTGALDNPRFAPPPWRPDRKALQLAAQVKDVLTWVLGSATGDDRLTVCSVESVDPLPGGNRLLVKVGVPHDVPMGDVSASLAAAAPALRAEVAQGITRRKVPELVYLPVPAG
jgi:ribosome-binding factor A